MSTPHAIPLSSHEHPSYHTTQQDAQHDEDAAITITVQSNLYPQSDPKGSSANWCSSRRSSSSNAEVARRERLGLLILTIPVLTMSSSTSLYRAAQTVYTVPSLTIAGLRGLTVVLFSLAASMCLARGPWADLRRLGRREATLLVIRGMCGGLNYACYIASAACLSAGDAAGVHATSTVLTALLSAATLGERLSFSEVVAATVSVIGVFLTATPWVSSSATMAAASSGALLATHSSRVMAVAIGLLSASLSAAGTVATRGLGDQVSFATSVLSHGTFSALVGLLGMAALPASTGTQCLPPGSTAYARGLAQGVGIAVLAGVMAFVGQAAYAQALQLARAGPVVVVVNLGAPVTYVFGVIFLAETPEPIRLLGTMLAVAGGVIVASGKLRGKG